MASADSLRKSFAYRKWTHVHIELLEANDVNNLAKGVRPDCVEKTTYVSAREEATPLAAEDLMQLRAHCGYNCRRETTRLLFFSNTVAQASHLSCARGGHCQNGQH